MARITGLNCYREFTLASEQTAQLIKLRSHWKHLATLKFYATICTMTHRIKIAQSVMDKAGAFGLQDHNANLAQLLKKMARMSAIASGNFNDERRRFGEYILTIRDNTVVDINCNKEGEVCFECLGVGFLDDGADCGCQDELDEPDVSETVGGNHW